MTGTRLALEQFDIVKSPQSNLDAHVSGSGGLTRNERLPHIEAIADVGAMQPMADPLIRPAPMPEEDPEQESIDALHKDLTQARTRLTGVIESIEADRANAQAAVIETAVSRVAEIGIAAIGHVVDQGFATEIAGAVAEIAAQIPYKNADLHVAVDDHETLVTALAGFAPDTAITLISDDSLARGQARMTWPDGGADFDATALFEKMAAMMTERLSDLTPRSR